MKKREIWNSIEDVLDQIIDKQREDVLAFGRKMIPTLTPEDILQPNDYPELENHPLFRYEEGYLTGLLAAQTALRALRSDEKAVGEKLF